MQLSELIEQLLQIQEDFQGVDPQVMISSNYGDRSNTEQLNNCENVSVLIPEKSAYSSSGLCVPDNFDESDDDGFDPQDNRFIVAIRYS